MKKLLSLVCVLALALAICVPAFAEDATSGQVDYVKDHPQDYESAKTLATSLTTQGYIDSDATAAMFNAIVSGGGKLNRFTSPSGGYRDGGADIEVWHVSGSTLNAVVNTPVNNTITLEFSFADGGQSELGAYVMVNVRKSAFDPNLTYMWENDAGQSGYVERIDETGFSIMRFYAPHFSTYTIKPVSAPASSPAPAASGNSGSVLASTNADLNTTVVVLAALALVLTAGCAVVLKKRALGK